MTILDFEESVVFPEEEFSVTGDSVPENENLFEDVSAIVEESKEIEDEVSEDEIEEENFYSASSAAEFISAADLAEEVGRLNHSVSLILIILLLIFVRKIILGIRSNIYGY